MFVSIPRIQSALILFIALLFIVIAVSKYLNTATL
jgi:hypothetical protein